MAGVVRERIRNWMQRHFPADPPFVRVFECRDVTDLLGESDVTTGLENREGMLFASRNQPVPAPRREMVILTRVMANYSAERIISALDQVLAAELTAHPETRLLLDDDLRVIAWGRSSTGDTDTEANPCR